MLGKLGTETAFIPLLVYADIIILILFGFSDASPYGSHSNCYKLFFTGIPFMLWVFLYVVAIVKNAFLDKIPIWSKVVFLTF